jgi:hypothetical protein
MRLAVPFSNVFPMAALERTDSMVHLMILLLNTERTKGLGDI